MGEVCEAARAPYSPEDMSLAGRVVLSVGGLRGDAMVSKLLSVMGEALEARAIAVLSAGRGGALIVWRREGVSRTHFSSSEAPEAALQKIAPFNDVENTAFKTAIGRNDKPCCAVGVLMDEGRSLSSARMLLDMVSGLIGAELELATMTAAHDALRLQLKTAAQLSREWFWRTDVAGRFTFLSEAVSRASALDSVKLLGKTREEALGPETVAANKEAFAGFRAAMQAQRSFRDIEYSAILADGQKRHVRVSGVPTFDANGRYSGYHGVAEDVTDLRQAEAAAQRNLQRLTDGVAAMPAGFALFDSEDRLVLCNDVYRETHRGAIGVDVETGMTFEHIARMAAQVGLYADAAAIEDPDGYLANRLAHHRNPDGAPIEQELSNGQWVQIAERPTMDGGVVTVRTDVTARKKAQRRLLDAIENVPVGFLMCGPDERVLLSNQRYRDLYPEFDGALEPGTPFEDLCRICGASIDTASLGIGFDAWLEARMAEFRNPGPPRQTVTMTGKSILVSEARTGDGGFVAAHVDVSPIVLLQEKLAVETRRAEEALEARSRFMANMSHDLRTPLNAVIGFADLMRCESSGPLGAQYREYAARIKAAGEFLLEMIVDILDMSRIEAGALRLELSVEQLGDVVHEVIDLIAPLAKTRNIRFSVEVSGTLSVVADRRRLSQVFQNLLSNAVKFSRDDVVTIAAREANGMVWIDVRDRGVGMTPEQAAEALKPFSRVHVGDGSEEIEGHGLGLSIAKAMVDLHGGTMEIESAPEAGCVVSFSIPRAGPKHPVS